MTTTNQEQLYTDVTGDEISKYRKLINAINILDPNEEFISAIMGLNFKCLATEESVKRLPIEPMCKIDNKHNCICSVKIKIMYVFTHTNKENDILIGSTCIKNIKKYCKNVHEHESELLQHLDFITDEIKKAERIRDYKECNRCGKRNIRKDITQEFQDDFCNKCEIIIEKAKEERKKAKKTNRKCFVCNNYTISKRNKHKRVCWNCIEYETNSNGKQTRVIKCKGSDCSNRIPIRNKIVNNINGVQLKCFLCI
tara:strand:- start:1201 stop:1962 length:762 start_codon:yes stop_codon:yes gene_type:complete